MKVSRGSFLKICGAAALGPGVDVGSCLTGFTGPLAHIAAIVTDPSSGRFRLRDASAARFRPHVNTAFTVRSTEGLPVRLVLAQVIDGPLTAGLEQFSLIFHGPADPAISHATYAFDHQALGAFDLFIGPVGGSNPRRTVYEACFSRHVSATARDSGNVRAARLEDESCRKSL